MFHAGENVPGMVYPRGNMNTPRPAYYRAFLTSVIFLVFVAPFVVSCAGSEVRAARRGDIDALREFIADGGDINEPQRGGRTLLHVSVENNEARATEFLIDRGAYVDAQDSAGRTPLMVAASRGFAGIADTLLGAGAHIDVIDSSGASALMFAIDSGHAGVFSLLLETGADVRLRDNNGRTPVIRAAQAGQVRFVTPLLEAGAGIDTTDYDGATALIAAAGRDHAPVVRELLEWGADVDIQDYDGANALYYALEEAASVGRGVTRSAELLIRAGAEVPADDTFGGALAFTAAESGNSELLSLLLEAGVAPEITDDSANTLLIAGVRHSSVVRTLLDRDVRVNAANRSGETALLRAVRTGERDSARMLLSAGADPDVSDNEGRSVLMQASAESDTELVRQLLLGGASVWARDSSSATVLHYAAERGSAEIIRLLLTAGADVSSSRDDGIQPIDMAVAADRSSEIINLLVMAGATPPEEIADDVPDDVSELPERDLADDAGITPEPEPEPEPEPDERVRIADERLAGPGKERYPREQRSRGGGGASEIVLSNEGDSSVEIVLVEPNGRPRSLGWIDAGDAIVVAEQPRSFFAVRDSEGYDIAHFRAREAEEQSFALVSDDG